jgi:excisionase family DNA binding protein
MEKEFYTVKELAELLVVKPVTIYRLVKRGDIPCYNVGGLKRFSKKDIDSYLFKVKRAH